MTNLKAATLAQPLPGVRVREVLPGARAARAAVNHRRLAGTALAQSATYFTSKVRLYPFCRLQAAPGLHRTVVGSIYLRGGRATGEGPR
jgi:hypothetical protein